VLLGSRDLFRTSLALTWDLSESFAVQGIYEHLSHGQILGSGRNQGLDEIGVRAVWRFN
jgi:lipid A 3-O-deacylase